MMEIHLVVNQFFLVERTKEVTQHVGLTTSGHFYSATTKPPFHSLHLGLGPRVTNSSLKG